MVTKEYQNFKFQQPYQQAMYYCALILQDGTWPWMEELEALLHLEADDLAKFAPVMLSRTFLECYIAGFLIFQFSLSNNFMSSSLLLLLLSLFSFTLSFVFQEILNVMKLNQ